MNPNTATEYRNLPLNVLSESTTNPRHIFEDAALKELADSIRTQGILSPLLVRPLTEQSFEIVAGARRYRAAQMAEATTVPVRIVNLTDAEALEAQLIENLQRRDVHPMEEAQGFRALLALEEPKYSIEQIAARTGKTPVFVASRLKLTELAPVIVEAFYREEIGVGHALLLAKLQPDKQEPALAACFKEEWSGGDRKAKRLLLPVRNLQFWIEHNILLILKQAPFNKRDAQLIPAAGSCVDCPKRTGHNKLLFADVSGNADACKLCGIRATGKYFPLARHCRASRVKRRSHSVCSPWISTRRFICHLSLPFIRYVGIGVHWWPPTFMPAHGSRSSLIVVWRPTPSMPTRGDWSGILDF
jgi:ParB family chromosome partitioning protein